MKAYHEVNGAFLSKRARAEKSYHRLYCYNTAINYLRIHLIYPNHYELRALKSRVSHNTQNHSKNDRTARLNYFIRLRLNRDLPARLLPRA
eukprot:scaffold3150_cov51-Attheya_sp.AAC.22